MITRLFYLSLFIGMMVPSFVFAQLSGTKTIGGSSPDYTTFAAAAAALNSSGVSGPVTFNVASGTYNEQITINSISGSSSANTITFQSATGDSTNVTLSYASATTYSSNFVVKLNGTAHIIFKGMTIERTGTNNYSSVVEVVGSGSDIYFLNNIIKNGTPASQAIYASLVYATTGNHTNSKFLRNVFMNGSYAVYNLGPSSSSLVSGLIVENNVFDNQGRAAVLLKYYSSPKINKNKITSSSTNSNYTAIDGLYIDYATEIKSNQIAVAKGKGIFLATSDGHGSKGLITNNFISIAGTGSGMKFSNSKNFHIYFNSVNILGASSTGLYITVNGSGGNSFKNNIIRIAGSSSYCMNVSNVSSAFTSMDYNDYYFPNGSMGKIGGATHATFAAWKTASGKDANSMNANPNFISNTDLHIVSSTIALKGTSANTSPFSYFDIDGSLRNTLTPDIGAHEFTVSDLLIDSIAIEKQMCVGLSYTIKVYIKNNGTAPISSIVPVGHQIGSGSAISLGLANIQNLAAGAVYIFTPTTKVQGNPMGSHPVKVWVKMQNDTDPANDTLSVNVLVSPYPISNLPNDTTVCAQQTVVLDPGAGYDSYLWYDGSTNQTIGIDSNGIGIGGKYISVSITDNGCGIKDSTLVLFKVCSSIDNVELSNSLTIYPNPASDFVNIDNHSNIDIQSIEILGVDGQLIRRFNDGQVSRINVSELPAGVYYIRIETNEGIAVKKLLKK